MPVLVIKIDKKNLGDLEKGMTRQVCEPNNSDKDNECVTLLH
jgi:hypothetical protein